MAHQSYWNSSLPDEEDEVPCVACRSRGVDRYGDDCATCGGFGSLPA